MNTSSTWWMALPAIVILFGGMITFLWKPSEQAVSLVQHFAAGTILAALMLEVFPGVNRNRISHVLLLPAFAIGAIAMFGLI